MSLLKEGYESDRLAKFLVPSRISLKFFKDVLTTCSQVFYFTQMSESVTQIDTENIDLELRLTEFEPPLGLDERQAAEDVREENFQYKSIEEVVKAQSAEGKEWVRAAESSGREYLNDETKESYYKDADGKKNVVLSRERDAEVLDDLFTKGFSIKERSEGDKVTRETYFADDKGRLSYVIDILSPNEDIILTPDDESAVLDEPSEQAQDDEPTSSDQVPSFGMAQVKETQVVYATAAAGRELGAPILESSSIESTGNEKVQAESVAELEGVKIVEKISLPELKIVTPIERSFFIPAELENKTAVAQAQPEISVIVEKKAEVGRDIQEFGIGLIEQDTEEIDNNVEETIEVQAEQPSVVNTMASQETVLVVQASETLIADTEEGITLVENAELETSVEIAAVDEFVTESTPAIETFIEAKAGNIAAPEISADVNQEVAFETEDQTAEKVTPSMIEITETHSAIEIFAAIETAGSLESTEQAQISEAAVSAETNEYQTTPIVELRAESTEAVENATETEQVDVVVEKVLTVVDTESKIEKQIVVPEVEPVIIDRIVANNERSERLVVEPQEVKVNLQAEAPVESERVVLFRRAESVEPIRETDETLRVEQVTTEPVLRAEQLSNNQSPIQNDSQAQVEDEELIPEPAAISLAA